MIPKIIHCCWFGGNPIPSELQEYMKSWRFHCPEYQIKIWNEDNFDINASLFTKTAYEHKKYAYVSDFVRAYALNKEGGIYLDTDVELKDSLDIFLTHEAFSGFEKKGLPFTAVWGSIPGHPLTQKVLEYYQDRVYTPKQEVNTVSVSELITNEFNINRNVDELQIGSNSTHSIHIYPSTTFCLDLPKNYAAHHFHGSWLGDKKTSYKEFLHTEYHSSLTLISDKNAVIKGLASSLSFTTLIKIFTYNIYYNYTPKSIKKIISIFRKK